jgi:hypothetical protein
MRKVANLLFGAGCLALICVSARGDVVPRSVKEYDAIGKNNVFKLKEPAPPAETPTPQPPLPKIFLSGITTMMNQKYAFLKAPAAPGDKSGEQSLMLREGQKEGSIEILEIDEKAGRVRINNSGAVMDLTFDRDAPTSNPPANAPGQPGPISNPPAMAQTLQSQPDQANAPNTNAPNYESRRRMPRREVRIPTPPPLPGPASTTPTGTMPTPTTTYPTVTTPAPTAPNPAAAQPGAAELTPEEARQVLNELDRMDRANPKP